LETVVEMKGITKRFPGVVANDHVDFDLKPGEIHALLGENGAGKTTLMNILYGLYRPDEGKIFVRGEEVKIRSPKDAMELGIARVPQFPETVDNLSVAENLALLLPGKILRKNKIQSMIKELAERYGLELDVDAMVYELSMGEKQRLELIKALCRGAEILILDEPTTVLTPSEVESLFQVLRRMKEEGKSIVFVSHKLEEVFAIADRITVLRRGKKIATVPAKEITKLELAKLMVGRPVTFELKKEPVVFGEEVLKVNNLRVLDDRGLLAVKGVSFSIRAGEIFGIAGVAGNGQRELVEAITGLRRVEDGEVVILGKDVTNKSSADIIKLGVAHIPDDRRVGAVLTLSVMDNLMLKNYTNFSKNGILDLRKARELAEKLIEKYKIVTPNVNVPVQQLSGGNIARLILARETSGECKLLIAFHPTFGLDVAATEEIRKLLLELRRKGVAILLVSEDLEEIMQLSDRIAVMYRGTFMGIVDSEKAKVEEIGLMMGGVKPET